MGWMNWCRGAIVALLFAGPVQSVFAEVEHESGCMTCHQYPGLAVIEPTGRERYLHIDEEARGQSPHAQVRCVQCHTRIDRTPHTDIDQIECTTGCHVQDRARIEAIDLTTVAIHAGEQTAIRDVRHRSACLSCHGIYPHTKDRHVRAIFNLHSAHLYCEVCHLDLARPEPLSYGWGPGYTFTFTGKPFGNVVGESDGGYVVERIGVFEGNGEGRKLIQHTEDLAAVGAFMLRASLSENELRSELDFFHRGIVRKKITVACAECHKQQGRLDFRGLGYGELRAEELESLNMRGWATRYDTFYFPKLF